VTHHDETYNYPIDLHLNEIGKQGWFLHSLIEKQVDIPGIGNDPPYSYISYRCVWQKISQSIGGLLHK
jgi:hypothetical protein